MNDRFKFRVIVEKNTKTINGTFNSQSIYYCNGFIQTKLKTYFYGNNKKYSFLNSQIKAINQCIGLKDKNGKLIYEGDIMNVLIDSSKPHYIKQVVVWDRKEWQLKTFNKDYRKNCSECGRQLRTKCKCCSEYFSASGHTNFKEFYNGIVIGNIYENKELLESEG